MEGARGRVTVLCECLYSHSLEDAFIGRSPCTSYVNVCIRIHWKAYSQEDLPVLCVLT